MMKHILYLGLAVAAALPAFAADPLNDAKAVQGSWVPATAELAGQPMAEAVLKSISLKLDNGKYEVFVGANPDRGTYTAFQIPYSTSVNCAVFLSRCKVSDWPRSIRIRILDLADATP
jgi:hypothetical protein